MSVELTLSTPQLLLEYLNDHIGSIDGISATETSIVLEIARRTYAELQAEESEAKISACGVV